MERSFIDICKELEKIFIAKNTMYGNAFFSNDVTDLERWYGGLKRKMLRLEHYYKTNVGKETEPLEDTYKDIAVYAIMQLILFERRQNEKVETCQKK